MTDLTKQESILTEDALSDAMDERWRPDGLPPFSDDELEYISEKWARELRIRRRRDEMIPRIVEAIVRRDPTLVDLRTRRSRSYTSSEIDQEIILPAILIASRTAKALEDPEAFAQSAWKGDPTNV